MQLVLASSSPIRRQLLEQLGLPFRINSPDIDESRRPEDSDIETYVSRLAREKALKVAMQFQHGRALVIAADQACTTAGEIVGKPGNAERALQQLQDHRGRWLHFHTGLAVVDTESGISFSSIDQFSVHMADLADADLEKYLELDQPWDCAGSFRLESRGMALFSAIQGNDYTSLLGLPLLSLCRLLREAGINPLDATQFSAVTSD